MIQRIEVRQDKSTAKDRVTKAIEENRELLAQMKKEGHPNDYN